MRSLLVFIVLSGTRHVLYTPLHNIIIFLLCTQFDLLALLLMLVMFQLVSSSGHLHNMFFLEMDMADSVDFLVFYDWIGAGIFLHIQ